MEVFWSFLYVYRGIDRIYSCCCIVLIDMVTQTVNFPREMYDEIADLAKQKCKGNFSKALRIKIGEKPERSDVILRLKE